MEEEERILGRVAGGFVGLAVGDALGVPVEFEPRSARASDPVTGMRSSESWKTGPGTWSDDTAIALCLAESIIEVGFDPDDFGRRCVAWLDEGLWSAGGRAIGVGGATERALARIRAGVPAVLAGGRGENDNGNGALMRILPASIWLAFLPEPARLRAVASYSAVTHGHPRSLLGSWLHCLLVARLLRGAAPKDAYAFAMEEARSLMPSLPSSLRAEAGAYARILGGSLGDLSASEIRGSGYVLHCLEASIWCLLRHPDFSSAVLAAVNLGEDADTTGAVTGGLAGLAYGRSAVPEAWAGALARSADIEALARGFAGLVSRPAPLPRSFWVLPGKFLAGGYPGRGRGSVPISSDPEGPEAERSKAAMDALAYAGIDAYVDLTSPGEAVGAPRYGVSFGTGSASAGRPELRSVPLEDMSADAAAVDRALRELGALLAAGRSVYLHCVGGLGRTGTVVGAFLVDVGLASPREALGVLKSLRADTDRPETFAPQTEEQRLLVARRLPGPSALPL